MKLPQISRDASAESRRCQRWYRRLLMLRIVALVVAAAGGALSGAPGMTRWRTLEPLGFIGALSAELFLQTGKFERRWWTSRALAESTKSLSWTFAAGGDPFPRELADADAELLFVTRINELNTDLATQIAPTSGEGFITPEMWRIRRMPLPDRKRIYLEERTGAQEQWYSRKSGRNGHNARLLGGVLVVGEAFCSVVAVAGWIKGWSIDSAGLAAGVLAAGGTWAVFAKYEQLAESYAVAARELGYQQHILSRVPDGSWAVAIRDAEHAISREHSAWMSARGNQCTAGPAGGGSRID